MDQYNAALSKTNNCRSGLCCLILEKMTLRVRILNFKFDCIPVKKGDRVAQLILEKIEMANVVETEQLDFTERGSGGFGSTGI